ncbi:hypothetical protein EV361DRAFT_950478 [Lentinula raphanica]|uniref:Uncharacterized protein n=1 Tax=Lentinula raphanica TaxID=153919 RepID=A0AA38PCH1_9AGAR|nr:hypothetical protein F5878DRAFT_659669 [Lentinula raphanica]KAJ3970543.1 hypothetical protein EV361DRAFT_950478 [Lentinula raphanica]
MEEECRPTSNHATGVPGATGSGGATGTPVHRALHPGNLWTYHHLLPFVGVAGVISYFNNSLSGDRKIRSHLSGMVYILPSAVAPPTGPHCRSTIMTSLIRLRTTTADVKKIDRHVQKALKNGIYKFSVKGIVLGTACEAPYIVHIPLDLGLDNFHSIDDLNVRPYLWMTNEPEFKSFDRNREHVDRFPLDARTALNNPYTFFFEEGTTRAATNRLIRNSGIPYFEDSVETLRGNVLVVKHKSDGKLDDMDNSDWPLVKVILEWMVGHRLNYLDTCPHGMMKPITIHRTGPGLPEVTSLTIFTPAEPYPRSAELLQTIYRIRDLRLTMFEHTGAVSLFAMAATCSTMRTWIQSFYRSRVRRLFARAFHPGRLLEFFDLLDSFQSRIGGSFAYAAVDPTSTFIPKDLNILVPEGGAEAFQDALVENWGCSVEPTRPKRKSPSTDVFASRTMYLQTPLGFSITLTESDGASLLPLMLTGYTTAECVLLGAHTFTLLYPSLVENGEVLRLPAVERAIPQDVVDTKILDVLAVNVAPTYGDVQWG